MEAGRPTGTDVGKQRRTVRTATFDDAPQGAPTCIASRGSILLYVSVT
jgi:hypothetical protein